MRKSKEKCAKYFGVINLIINKLINCIFLSQYKVERVKTNIFLFQNMQLFKATVSRDLKKLFVVNRYVEAPE